MFTNVASKFGYEYKTDLSGFDVPNIKDQWSNMNKKILKSAVKDDEEFTIIVEDFLVRAKFGLRISCLNQGENSILKGNKILKIIKQYYLYQDGTHFKI